MAYGSVLTDVVQSSTSGTPPQFNDGNGTQVGTLCRAWVNFNSFSGTVSVRASFNVSSVVRNSAGNYTINFSNALPDANYTTSSLNAYTIVSGNVFQTYLAAATASSVQVRTFNGLATPAADADYVQLSIFR